MNRPVTDVFRVSPRVKNEQGYILAAALTLMSALTLAGVTAYMLSSTDIKIGANFRNNQSALQVAMAGAEHGRNSLAVANLASSDNTTFSDELLNYRGNNNQINGSNAGTDDVPIASGTLTNNNSNYSYSVYLTNDPQDANGWNGTTDSNKRVMITSVAAGANNAKATVQTIVKIIQFPTVPGAVYSKDTINLNGSSLTINGNDASGCSGGNNQPPTYTLSPAQTCYPSSPICGTGPNAQAPTLQGNPNTPQSGSTDIDIATLASELENVATVKLTSNTQNATFGSSTSPKIVYANATTMAAGQIVLNNVTGYGILVIQGDLSMAGNFNWHGPVIVTGVASTSGGGNQGKNIDGQLVTGQSALGDTNLNGAVTVQYNSCMLKKASATTLPIVSWKQIY